MEIDEILSSASFWVLSTIGYAAFVFMLVILKGMDQKEIMPLWVKIAVLILIPIISAMFSGYAEG